MKLTTKILCAVAVTALVAGCNNTANDSVREGPQAVHPSPSKLAQGGNVAVVAEPAAAPAAGRTVPRSRMDAEDLFSEYCLDKPNTAATEAAIQASGRFDAPLVNEEGTTRTATYLMTGDPAASITVVAGSPSGLLCSVNVNNSGPSLFLDGSVTRD